MCDGKTFKKQPKKLQKTERCRTFAIFVKFERLGDVLERFSMMMFLLG